MFPIIPSTTTGKYYPGSSPAHTDSSAYTMPSQPPLTNSLSRQHSQWRGSPTQHSPAMSPTRTHSRSERPPPPYSSNSSTSYNSTRKPSFFSLRNSTSRSSSTSSASSSSSLDSPTSDFPNVSRHGSVASTSSFSSSLKSIFSRSSTPEERAARKAEKERRKTIERAEDAAYRRAQDMEANALYMAWRYGDGSNAVSYAMY